MRNSLHGSSRRIIPGEIYSKDELDDSGAVMSAQCSGNEKVFSSSGYDYHGRPVGQDKYQMIYKTKSKHNSQENK